MQQTIVRLRHMEGMEMRQIAELTGSSEVAVRKALSRARKAIKEQFLNHKN
jgi:RNA polymerase sigma-70 factor (ECF subfamily)